MITEAEFCAMAVEQEAGDLVACVATGSTTRARLSRWVSELHLASYILQSFDEDESGDEGAQYWLENLKKCYRWSPYVAKDPNDILLKKFLPDRWECSIREWVEMGMQTVIPPEQAPIPLARVLPPLQKMSLLEQGIREYRGRILSPEKARIVSGEPIKPNFDCFFCKNHPKKKNHWAWTWSSLDGECVCVECLSPSSWSVNMGKR